MPAPVIGGLIGLGVVVADYLFNDGVTRQAFAVVFASLVAFCGLVLTVGAYAQRRSLEVGQASCFWPLGSCWNIVPLCHGVPIAGNT